MSITPSIPASQLVSVNPGVVAAGGSSLSLLGLILSYNTRVPIGTVLDFSSAAAVGAYFGLGSVEYAAAQKYFQGFDNSTVKPASLLFAQYPWAVPVAPYLRGGDAGALGLTALQGITPATLTVTINGTVWTSGTITLAGLASFSLMAAAIQTALGATDAAFTASITGFNMTVTAISQGALAPGQVVTGVGVTAGQAIVSQTSGTTGGQGVYVVSDTQTVSSEVMNSGAATVSYDSTSGGFVIKGGTPGTVGTIGFASGGMAAPLLLTAATGAVLSQGAPIATPNAFMTNILTQTTNWATVSTIFNPVAADKVAFAGWVNGQNGRYVYVDWENDATLLAPNPTTSAPYLIGHADYSGTFPMWDPATTYAAPMIQGFAASVDFSKVNGRVTFAYLSQTGQSPTVSSGQQATELLENGVNFYGDYSAGNNSFNFVQNGQISGPFDWMDSYLGQIKLNADMQIALITYLTDVGNTPYNADGFAAIEEVLAGDNGPIQSALNFGTIRAGVQLSSTEIQAVNQQAGLPIAPTLQAKGWYLLVSDPGSAVRAARGSPVCILWYTDGGSIQTINLSSLLVQ